MGLNAYRAVVAVAVLGLAAATTSACKKSSSVEERCWKATRHVTEVAVPEESRAKPGSKEANVIEAVIRVSAETCIAEGLTVEQAACIMKVDGFKALTAVGDCPAIKATQPSWLAIPGRKKAPKSEASPPAPAVPAVPAAPAAPAAKDSPPASAPDKTPAPGAK